MSIPRTQIYLKCIGGPCDGRIIHVDLKHRLHDHIRIAPRKTLNLGDPISELTKQYIYKISLFCFDKDDDYYFLVPEKWTDKQAILHQFGK